jgi:tetratricopeptide (TPR) repeat protein
MHGDTCSILRSCGTLSVLGFLAVEKDTEEQEDVSEIVETTYRLTENMNESQTLEIGPDAGPADIERAYTLKRLEWTQIHGLVKGDPDLEPRVTEIQFRLAAAYHRLTVDEPPRQGTRNLLRPSASGTNTTTSKPQTGAQKLGSRAAAQTATATEKELLNDVKAYFNAQDWDAAIPVLFRLVELDPTNASYRGFLAKAMFKHPTLRGKAERHFLEAIQLRPLDPKLHLWLGVYYKSFGQSARAATAFRTALELDPDNSVARKYLLSGKMKNETVC